MLLSTRLLGIILAAVLSAAAQSPRPPRQLVGPQSDGSVLLPTGWKVTPAGKQIPLSTLPMSMALSRDERYLLVLNGGYLPPSISVIDLETESETDRVAIPDGWLGLTFNPAGDKVYVSGGSEVSVFEFHFEEGKLRRGRAFPVIPPEKRRESDHVGDVLVSPDGRLLYVANLFRDSVTVMNAQTGFVISEIATGRRPYRLLLSRDDTLLVSHWAESSIGVYGLTDGRLIERFPVGLHPTDMLLLPSELEQQEGRPPIVARLFVACASTNSVWVLGITEGNRFVPQPPVSVAPTPRAPAGSTPTALAISADGRLLYTASSDNNAIVVSDVSLERPELAGAIPTGWYPTAVKTTQEGKLLYLSGKGGGSRALPRGPDPTRRGEERLYVAAVQTGSLGIVPPLNEQQYERLTRLVVDNIPYRDEKLTDAGIPAGNPVPNRPGEASPIEHVVYVVKENRTYDQVLGAIEQGNGDSSLVVFGEEITPNHHALAREFVLVDNFYATGDVSADGQNWSFAAIASDYVQKLWPSYYGRRRKIYDFEGGEPAAVPPAGYLWSNALGKGLTVRNYGVWTSPAPTGSPLQVRDMGLAPHTNRDFAGFDLGVPDLDRVNEFLRDFRQLESEGRLPRLLLVRLPGDHTAGRAPGKLTARAMMAEHDLALGRLVEGVSQSPAWAKTVIFVIEDDAQDGSEHVDSHRAPAFVISPFAKRGSVDSTLYATASVLRTIELILGLAPMTQYDAAATPMAAAFTPKPDPRPYQAKQPKVSLEEKNPPGEGGLPRRVKLRDPREQAPAIVVAWF